MQPSAALKQVLGSIARFDDASLIAISYWASYPNPQAPEMPATDLDRVQVETLTLGPTERDALFTWLAHHGRAKLYALGVTDGDIGPCQNLIDLKECHSSQQHPPGALADAGVGSGASPGSGATSEHDLLFTIASAAAAASGIALESGFAAVDANANSFTHCITFRNATQKTAAALTFTYKILAPSGDVLTAGSDILVGSFTPGSEAAGPKSFVEFAHAHQAKSMPPNCWTKSFDATDPTLRRAASLTIGVASVTYEDGSHWSL